MISGHKLLHEELCHVLGNFFFFDIVRPITHQDVQITCMPEILRIDKSSIKVIK